MPHNLLMTTTELEKVTDEILDTECSDDCQALAEKLLSRSPYTTTALFALELAARANGDDAGADMIGEFVRKFAQHEAETV